MLVQRSVSSCSPHEQLNVFGATAARFILKPYYRFDSEVHLLYVAKPDEYYVEDETAPFKTIYEQAEAFQKAHCQEVSTLKVAVFKGEPADEILDYADKNGVDLIIMTIKGKTQLGKIVFGSTAGQVIREAAIPVLVINPK
jgi:nucleotide-binding universal stress UspA family protein